MESGEVRSHDREPEDDRTVLVVDDQRSLAEAVGIAVGVYDGLVCVGIVGSVEAAMEACAKQRVDAVLMDMQLPGLSGMEGAELIKERWPDTDVYIFSGHGDAGLLTQAAVRGVAGFFPKDAPIAEVLEGVRCTHPGQMLVDTAALASYLERRRDAERDHRWLADPPLLTGREWAVLRLLCDGIDPQTIAASLGLSVFTARGYVKSILAKLGVHSQLEAVVVTLRNRWLDSQPTDLNGE